MSVAVRLGVRLVGVNGPGHFLLRYMPSHVTNTRLSQINTPAQAAAPTSTPSSSTPPSATPQHHMAFVPGDGRDKGRTLYVDAFNQVSKP